MTTQFQAYLRVNNFEQLVGARTSTAAEAWHQVYMRGFELWPSHEQKLLRRTFEDHCEVRPVTVVEIA